MKRTLSDITNSQNRGSKKIYKGAKRRPYKNEIRNEVEVSCEARNMLHQLYENYNIYQPVRSKSITCNGILL